MIPNTTILLSVSSLFNRLSKDLMTIFRKTSETCPQHCRYRKIYITNLIWCVWESVFTASVTWTRAKWCRQLFQMPHPPDQRLTASDGTVGYGRHGQLGPEPKKIATICVGYADGVNRHLGRGNASFEVNGKLAPTIGNICMDMCMLDITGIEAKVGDTVTIFGAKPSAIDLAEILDTIPYEIFTSISHRVRRVIID